MIKRRLASISNRFDERRIQAASDLNFVDLRLAFYGSARENVALLRACYFRHAAVFNIRICKGVWSNTYKSRNALKNDSIFDWILRCSVPEGILLRCNSSNGLVPAQHPVDGRDRLGPGDGTARIETADGCSAHPAHNSGAVNIPCAPEIVRKN